jgi:hypothetical protein
VKTRAGQGSNPRALNPVQSSPLSGSAHTQPVFSIIRSGNGRLTTVSTDARVCVWSLENLLAPVEVRDLRAGEEAEIYGVLSADLPVLEKGTSALPSSQVVLGKWHRVSCRVVPLNLTLLAGCRM